MLLSTPLLGGFVIVIFEKLKCYHVLRRPTSGLVGGTPTVKIVKRLKKKKLARKQTCRVINKMMECIFCSLVCGSLHKVLLVVIGHSRVQFYLIGHSSLRTTLENVINQLASLELERMSSKIKLMYMCRLEGRMLLFSLYY